MLESWNIFTAFLITLFAWLATWIGSLIAFFAKSTNERLLSVSLWFSAWAMIYISFVELFPQWNYLIENFFWIWSSWIWPFSFFIWFLAVALIDFLIPNYENPHEMHKIEEIRDEEKARKFNKLYRVWIVTALAIAVHNFPEGFATFLSSMSNIELWIMIAFAVAIHNIPEWIAIAIPIYYATNSRKKAFFYSFASWLTEPIWGLIAFLLLKDLFNDWFVWVLFALVSGIMVFISFDSLLPSANKYWNHHLSIYWLVAWMIVMAVSLIIL